MQEPHHIAGIGSLPRMTYHLTPHRLKEIGMDLLSWHTQVYWHSQVPVAYILDDNVERIHATMWWTLVDV